MTNAKILQFPRPPLDERDAPRVVSPRLEAVSMTYCDGYVHVFADVPGRCQCGTELWDEVPTT